ncbi:glycine-rich cell wall structural protein 1.8 [Brachypodium distachyon]|uniref:Uncharacterized protein n=1 Tax=Brachypodium distachyon TaxID=15368 RepID=I1HUF8_BRADI|nr:glycine-rich cell wall structural protein 1.8 [Brachypodium distachyon]KQK11130.1 hypothetical protein BRADI_2g58310v3 [Brachypodium distachyon]|eukprot:XP_010232718.1 glycine-rich cell wall structural protein 1.8 [Brachypodium distachyon]
MSMPKRSYGFGGYGYGQKKPLVNYHTSQNGDSVTTVVKEMTRMTVTEKPGYGAGGGAALKHGAFLEEVCEEDAGAGVYSHGGSAVQKHGYEQKAAYGQQHGSEVVGSGYEYDSTLQQHEQKHGGGFVDGHKTSSYQHHGSSDNFAGAGYVDDAAVQHDAAKNYTVKKHHGGYEQKAYGQQQQQHGGFGGYESYDAAGYDVDAGLLHGSTGVQKQHGYGYGGTQKRHGGGHKGYGYADGQNACYQQQQGFDADGIAGYEYDAFDMKAQQKRGYSGAHKAAYRQPQVCDDGIAGYDALVQSREMQKQHGAAYGQKGQSYQHGGVQQSYGKAYKHQVAGAGALTQYKQECESEDESDCSEEESDCDEELALAHAGHGGAGGAYGFQAYKQQGKLAGSTTRQYESYHSSTTTGGYSGGGYGGWTQRKNHSLF